MESALYCPVYGYYETEKDTIGRRGDYYTNVSVGSLFGELLAFQMAEWLEHEDERLKSGVGDSFRLLRQIVEAGAHDGSLARDILQWMQQFRPHLFQHLEYWIIEPSATRREWQKKNLATFSTKVHWAETLAQLGWRTEYIPSRIIFANELLDAMPVHRFGWDAKARVWFEWGVTLKGGRFSWAGLPACTVEPLLPPDFHASEISKVLPDGFVLERSPAAEAWWRSAAEILKRGKLMALDYGMSAEEFLMPERQSGTLRAYRNHQVTNDVLADAGDQDITAHVNFSAIQSAGESAGLATEAFVAQEQFLTRIVSKIWEGKTVFGEWTPSRTRQFQTLAHPQHLGRSFRVLVQGRSA